MADRCIALIPKAKLIWWVWLMLASWHVLQYSGQVVMLVSAAFMEPSIFGSASSATGSAIFALFVKLLNDTLHIIPRFDVLANSSLGISLLKNLKKARGTVAQNHWAIKFHKSVTLWKQNKRWSAGQSFYTVLYYYDRKAGQRSRLISWKASDQLVHIYFKLLFSPADSLCSYRNNTLLPFFFFLNIYI